jgi:hypothetical protein
MATQHAEHMNKLTGVNLSQIVLSQHVGNSEIYVQFVNLICVFVGV